MNTRKKRSMVDIENELEGILRAGNGNVALTDPEVIRFLYDTFPVDTDC